MTDIKARIADEPPKGFTPTLALAWVEGVGEHDQFGMIQPVLHQGWKDWSDSYVWVPVPTYVLERKEPPEIHYDAEDIAEANRMRAQ